MRYYNQVRNELEAKYNQSFNNIKIMELHKVLNGKDYDKFVKAMKYPNGIIRSIT